MAEVSISTASNLATVILAALTMVPGLGRVGMRRLLSSLQSRPEALVAWWQNEIASTALTPTQVLAVQLFKKKWTLSLLSEYFTQHSDFFVSILDAEYPDLLRASDDPPILIFGRGERRLLKKPSIAVVGTRRITQYGQLAVAKLVPGLVADGWVIVSGAMYGVDEAAHRQAIVAGGVTVGVLGYGLAATNSRQQKQLLADILISGGILVTEYPPLTTATKGTFVQRNRVIAGLSYGTLVVEAAANSGSLITAQCALDAGRAVFAVPGSIASPFSTGTKQLLNQGAHFVSESHELSTELIQQLKPELRVTLTANHSQQQSTFSTGPLSSLVMAVRHQHCTAAQLAAVLQQNLSEVLTELQRLELEGLVYRDGEVWYAAHL